MKLDCAATDTNGKPITSTRAVLIPVVTYLLSLPRSHKIQNLQATDAMPPPELPVVAWTVIPLTVEMYY